MFCEKTFEFLIENRFRNSRQWFLDNKETYNNFVFKPLQQLATALAPTIYQIDNQIITEAKTDKTISRIYRDTRFSKDKMLYREEMWLSFKRDKKAFPHYPEFFIVISPEYFLYGCGYYAPTTSAMESLRNLILKNDISFEKALKSYEKQSTFVLDGDKYKRSKFHDKPEKIKDWLDRKNISLIHQSKDLNQLFSKDITQKISKDLLLTENIYNLFIKAETLA
ncbi:MAG: DUF2461 domain-containing protein, partial [Oscillospiraceae bacterium]